GLVATSCQLVASGMCDKLAACRYGKLEPALTQVIAMNDLPSSVDSIRRKIASQDFRRDPIRRWTRRGAGVGGVVGLVGSAILLAVATFRPGGSVGAACELLPLVVVLLVAGPVVGALPALVWLGVVRPVLLAILNSERYLREYGSKDEG